MIKCIACDMDGSLLRTGIDLIEESTVEKLNQCKENGIMIMLATGRDYTMVKEVIDEYNLQAPLVLNNGTQYCNADKSNNVIYPMDKDSFLKITRILMDLNYLIVIHTDSGKYSTRPLDEFWQYHSKLLLNNTGFTDMEQLPDKLFTRKRYMDDMVYVKDPQEVLDAGVNPLKIDARRMERDGLTAVRELLDPIQHLHISSSYADNIEITGDLHTKGSTLLDLLSSMGIKKDEVATFGDGLNDISMLEGFPYSFAPSVSLDVVKEKAAFVCKNDCDHGFVKEGIELLESKGLINLK